MSSLVTLILLTLLGSVVGLIGGVVFLYVKSWSETLTKYSVPFAAGVLTTVALMGLLAEAVQTIGEQAFLVTLLAFLGAYVFENAVCALHHHGECDHHGTSYKGSTWLIVVGDTIHNTIDGVAIASAYLTNPGLGLITAVSTFLHEVPHEIGDFGILLKAGWARVKVLWVNIVSSLFTVIGALVIFYFTNDPILVGYSLAIAAGMFLYLGASDFLPHASEDLSPKKALISVLIGAGIMLGTFKLIPHASEQNHQGNTVKEKNYTHLPRCSSGQPCGQYTTTIFKNYISKVVYVQTRDNNL